MKKSAPILAFCALAALLTAGASPSPSAVSAVCRVASDPLRRLLVFASSPFPFPLFEIALPALPAAFVYAAVRSAPRVFFRRTLSFGGVLFSLFLLLSVLPSRRVAPPDPTPPTDAELTSFAVWLSEGVNAAESTLSPAPGRGTPPARPSAAELSAAVTAALRAANLAPIPPLRVKATLFPRLLSRLGLLGYHAALTGEAVIDPDAPAYTLAFTAAHEAAHQAGILSEGEASYAAYVALAASPDPALRYAGLAGALDAVLPLLSSPSRESIFSSLSPRVREDLSLFDAILPTGNSASAVRDGNAAAIRLRGGSSSPSYDLFPILACRRFLADAAGDASDPTAIY